MTLINIDVSTKYICCSWSLYQVYQTKLITHAGGKNIGGSHCLHMIQRTLFIQSPSVLCLISLTQSVSARLFINKTAAAAGLYSTDKHHSPLVTIFWLDNNPRNSSLRTLLKPSMKQNGNYKNQHVKFSSSRNLTTAQLSIWHAHKVH